MKALTSVNAELGLFPANATDLVQPADSIVNQKLKDAWSLRWVKYKMDIVIQNGFASASEKITKLGKSFYLGLAAAAVRDINAMRDSDGLRYARKAMIRTGTAQYKWSMGRKATVSEAPIVPKYLQQYDRTHVVDEREQ